jgi:hypothetical protein
MIESIIDNKESEKEGLSIGRKLLSLIFILETYNHSPFYSNAVIMTPQHCCKTGKVLSVTTLLLE